MTDTTNHPRTTNDAADAAPTAFAVEASQNDVSNLLAQLQGAAPAAIESKSAGSSAAIENQLAMVRLGIATSLFYSLRTKHALTAAQSLRVAIVCSCWAERLGLAAELRNQVEVAALLHDLGKIGIPDRILRKPSKLTAEEQLTMDCCPDLAVEILRGCTDDPELLAIVRYSNTWYDSRRQGESPSGDALPFGSRMLVIANAFDSMTTEHVYRSALSRERALQQLLEGSGTQFDPDLVLDFAAMLEERPEMLQGATVDRWLSQLQQSDVNSRWSGVSSAVQTDQVSPTIRRETRFHTRLLKDLKDGVAFTDAEGVVTHWNGTMNRLTGVSAEAAIGQKWCIESIGLRRNLKQAKKTICPLKECFKDSKLISRSMELVEEFCEPIPVRVQVSPVKGENHGLLGAVIVLHDNSVRSELEEQLESLHHKTTVDGLTGVANRAHFDDMLDRITEETAAGGPTFSLVICDIDHFKRVNDVHGHPAGDEALVQFAAVLQEHSRDGDLVARYGGEEFLLVAHNCDNATAAKRAEAIRMALERTALPSLGGECVTASFGVTEYQAGDSAETVLARSDRALLKAKDNGRNRVVQLGTGVKSDSREKTEQTKGGWFGWFGSGGNSEISEVDILTPVPANLAIEKLKGFIADHDAEIINVTESQVTLKINALCPSGGRRRVDQRFALKMSLTLSEARPEEQRRKVSNTKVHMALSPIRKRDRRNQQYQRCIALVVSSLRSYLMGVVINDDSDE